MRPDRPRAARHPQPHGVDPGGHPARPAVGLPRRGGRGGRGGGRRPDRELPGPLLARSAGVAERRSRARRRGPKRASGLFRALDAVDPADLGARAGDGAGPRRSSGSPRTPSSSSTPGASTSRRHPPGHPDDAPDRVPPRQVSPARPGAGTAVPPGRCARPDRPAGTPIPAGRLGASLERAVQWQEVLESHARRLYGCLDRPTTRRRRSCWTSSGRHLAGSLRRPRGLSQGLDAARGTPDRPPAVTHLEELGWLRSVELKPPNGPPRIEVYMHPKLREGRE